MAEPVDMIVPLLRETRAENASLHEQTRVILVNYEKRIEEKQTNYRQALTADTLTGELLSGALEKRVRELQDVR